MLRLLMVGGLAVCISFLAGCARPAGPALRLASWNVHACRYGIEAVADQLRRIDADLICLQEVESGLIDSPEVNQARRLAELTGMHAVFTPEPMPGTDHEQLSIMARYPLSNVEYLEKNTSGRYYGISALCCLDDGSPIRLVCVHLTSNDESHVVRFFATGMRRLREVNDLIKRLKEMERDVILAGDFNSGPGMIEHAAIGLCTRWIPNFCPTFPAHAPFLQLDHVFLRGDLRASRLHVERTGASDHRPLIAEVRLAGRSALGHAGGRQAHSRPAQGNSSREERCATASAGQLCSGRGSVCPSPPSRGRAPSAGEARR